MWLEDGASSSADPLVGKVTFMVGACSISVQRCLLLDTMTSVRAGVQLCSVLHTKVGVL